MSDAFFAWFQGRGEGCDYTIGCNQRVVRLKATTLDAAIREAIGSEWSEYDDERVKRVTILRVAEEYDCAETIDALRRERESKKAAQATAAKRAQLERLKRELGET